MQRRERIIRMVKGRLLRRGRPRLLVSLILALTGLAGFLVSYALLHSGMTRMWLRYPLAILFAYCVFLLLLRFWLFLQRPPKVEIEDFEDVDTNSPFAGDNYFEPRAGRSDLHSFVREGDAGAGGSWGQQAPVSSSSSSAAAGGGSGSSGGGWGSLDLDEGFFIVAAIAVIAGALLAVFYVVYVAPALLAEILVDGVLVAGLYRELKGVEQRHWLRSAVRKTLLPALIAAALFSLGGYFLQRAAPKARSVGEVWKYVTED
ncbi:MAG TPA: hypothetical protein VN256_00675 [Pyrinomonadaceae bacterium]|nr:hypothetical protein [Pyrinomonadaceae bacterium]